MAFSLMKDDEGRVTDQADHSQSPQDAADCRSLVPILQAMAAVDSLLEAAISAQVDSGARRTLLDDPLRGLHLSGQEVAAELAIPPAAPLLSGEAPGTDWSQVSARDDRLQALARVYGLDGSEVGALLIALAPEVDQRYGRAFALLNDDVTRPAPAVGLLLRLLFFSAPAVIAGRRLFSPTGRLLTHRLVRLDTRPTLLASEVRVDSQIVRFLLRESGLDPHLDQMARLLEPSRAAERPGQPAVWALELLEHAAARGRRVALHLRAPASVDPAEYGRLAADRLQRRALEVDLAQCPTDSDRVDIARTLVREAWLFDRLLIVKGIDRFRVDHPAAFAELLRLLARMPIPVLLTGSEAWRDEAAVAFGPLSVDLSVDDSAERRALWNDQLRTNRIAVSDADLDALAARFHLQPLQIATAVSEVAAAVLEDGRAATLAELAAAARRRSGDALERLASRVAPRRGWDDLVLPDDALRQLEELVSRVAMRDRVIDGWGFRGRGTAGGTVALFAGPSGTGKTLAAEVVAGALQLDMFRIDLARIVDKYIGETEKNLDRIFAAAEGVSAVLCFDEADALFGKRSEVKDAHDRYANLEIAYLLQKMEAYEGVAILTTNLLHNLDEAFIRRLAFLLLFPFPDDAMRERIWRVSCPPDLPLAPEVDFGELARRHRLSGGNIRNAVVAAAFLAAAGDEAVRMRHFEHAVAREFQKMGKRGPVGRD